MSTARSLGEYDGKIYRKGKLGDRLSVKLRLPYNADENPVDRFGTLLKSTHDD